MSTRPAPIVVDESVALRRRMIEGEAHAGAWLQRDHRRASCDRRLRKGRVVVGAGDERGSRTELDGDEELRLDEQRAGSARR